MITSFLDTDFYKLTMMQTVFHHYAGAWAEYKFKWRNWDRMSDSLKTHHALESFMEELNTNIRKLCNLRFAKDELAYLDSIHFFKPDFIEYLRLFQLNEDYIARVDVVEGIPNIIVEGPWLNTILFEVPILAIVSELYTKHTGLVNYNIRKHGMENLKSKLTWLKRNVHRDAPFQFADFGTRRRASYEWHEEVIEYLLENARSYLAGTSNVLFAMNYEVKPIGTMAHEFIQAHQQLGPRLVDSQAKALQTWADEYRGELGIALSDCLGFDMFLKDFDRYFALLFDGCRHDSGDPTTWAEKLINHYRKLRIDPRTKTAVFSDGLTFEIAVELFKEFHTQINTAFGIGTYLTNDCGFEAPQIVMKMTKMNHKPVAKISDSPGKGMCEDEGFLTYLKQVVKEKVEGKW
ncbi:MAG: nicotinate phosphoribosyltransferase [Candidatus Thorarchaeota archaeon]|nr:MAG: nicotinate phosphoribosyltransferase [Candidatus Thorarchaeota archaeon]